MRQALYENRGRYHELKAAASIAAIAVLLASPSSLTSPIVLEDPAGDDHGPGRYVCPAAEGMRPGSFDLRRVSLNASSDSVAIAVTFARTLELVKARFGRDGPVMRIFYPVVDIYVQTPGGGAHQDLLPGRRVAPALGWDRAVVLSAVPDLLAAHYRRVASDLAADTCFARTARAVGATLSASVPRRCLPGDLEKAGFLVVVTGLGAGAGLGDIILGGPRTPDSPDPFVREVQEQPGQCGVWEGTGASPCWCGGCRPCGWHPFVLDAIVPRGASQEALLSGYSESAKRLAVLPFVTSEGEAVVEATSPARLPGPRHPVVSIRGRHVSIRLTTGTYPPGTIAAIICPGERSGGTAVVTGEAAGFVVLEKVGDDSPLCQGAEIEF